MRFVSFLRGINVGGHKKIKMVDLKAIYESLGLLNVDTYIQSGNVAFDARKQDDKKLIQQLEEAIEKKYKFLVPVQIRTNSDLLEIVDNCPFGPVDLAENGSKIHVGFLDSLPTEKRVADLNKQKFDPEELVCLGREIYVNYPNGCARSKLSNIHLEKQLQVGMTSRNWRTVVKMVELSEEE